MRTLSSDEQFLLSGRASTSKNLEAVLDKGAAKLSPDLTELADWHDRYFKTHRKRLATDLELCVSRVSDSSSVLEIGAIPLHLTLALTNLGFETTGVDIAPERYTKCIEATGLNIVRCDIEREPLPFADGTFSAVVFNEVFEHLRIDLNFTLSEVSRVMQEGAVLLLSTPNLYSYRGLKNLHIRGHASAICGNLYQEYSKLEQLGHMGHVREYTAAEVSKYLANFNLMKQEIIFRGHGITRFERVILKCIPKLRPFFSIICQKRGIST